MPFTRSPRLDARQRRLGAEVVGGQGGKAPIPHSPPSTGKPVDKRTSHFGMERGQDVALEGF